MLSRLSEQDAGLYSCIHAYLPIEGALRRLYDNIHIHYVSMCYYYLTIKYPCPLRVYLP